MVAQKQISCDSVYDRVPPLSSKYLWLVAQNLEGKDEEQIFYTIDNPLSYYRCQIPELSGRQIEECYHGWVILSNDSDMVTWSLWNPITSRLICLPPLTLEEDDSYECCLSSPPDDPSSIFLITITEKATIFFCQLNCKRKELRWTKMSYAKQIKQLKSTQVTDDIIVGFPKDNGFLEEYGFLRNPSCCNGKVYACTIGPDFKFLIEVDIVIKDTEVVISLLPIVNLPAPSFNRCPSFNSCWEKTDIIMKGFSTELFYIEVGFEDEMPAKVGDVFLFKLDIAKMTWEEMKDLEGAIYISDNSVIYRPEIASELGGYIHILHGTGKVIYSYNVKYRTVSISSMPCMVQTSQAFGWTIFECRLGDHADSEQKGEDTDVKTVVRRVTGDSVEFYSTTDELHLLNIPFDVLEMIMKLCVGVDYLNFRATCKRCHIAAPPIQWSNETALRRLQTYSLVSPWLMVLDQHQGILTFTDPLLGDKYFLKIPHELIGFEIYCSRYGWLLMYKVNGPMVFYNPFTNDIRKFPKVDYLNSHCFSAPPTSPDCIVVGFRKIMESLAHVHFVGREQFWRENEPELDYYLHFPTFHGQDVYALTDNGGIHVFKKLGQEDYSRDVVIAEAPLSCRRTTVKRYLASCDQHLIQVIVDELGEYIEVFNLDDSKKEWKKIDGLGKHMIYVCGTTCLCVEARTPEMENKVYFPRLRSKKIVFYSLETCRYHTFNGKMVGESFGDFVKTEYHTYGDPHAWIEPSWTGTKLHTPERAQLNSLDKNFLHKFSVI